MIHDPVHDSVASEMKSRLNEYSRKVQIDVFVGTYNLNGKLPEGTPLDPWLCFDKGIYPGWKRLSLLFPDSKKFPRADHPVP
jgi:hypothetical protein